MCPYELALKLHELGVNSESEFYFVKEMKGGGSQTESVTQNTMRYSFRPSVESITDDNVESNCSMIENIPPKGVSFSDFICIFAMPDEVLFDYFFATLS